MKGRKVDTRPHTWPKSAVDLYDPEVVFKVLEDHDGAGTARELAKELGVHRSTFLRWMREHPEFGEAVRDIRAGADDEVEVSLHERATGYTETTEDRVYERDPKTGKRELKKLTVKENHIAADVGAAKLWLTNRRREDWTERKIVEVQHSHGELLRRIENEVLDLGEDDYEEIDSEQT